jgi:hypothetical protein
MTNSTPKVPANPYAALQSSNVNFANEVLAQATVLDKLLGRATHAEMDRARSVLQGSIKRALDAALSAPEINA